MKLVFDLGGVLLDWRPAALLATELPQHAPDETRAQALVHAFFGGFGGDWAEFDRGTIEAEPLAGLIAARAGLSKADAARVIAAVPGVLTPIAEMVALMEALKARGHALYYLSNMPAPYADLIERSHAFFRHFDGGIFSSRVRLIKPDPAIFRLALQRFGAQAADCVFIDDLAANVAAAEREGWQALHFTGAERLRDALERLGALSAPEASAD